MQYLIGIDMGASTINFVLLNSVSLSKLKIGTKLKDCRITRIKKIKTPRTRKGIITALEENIKDLILGIRTSDIKGIGIGVPGPLNKKGDLILNPPNLTCLKNCPLGKIIRKDLGIRTKMDHDVNCFTLAEAALGAGRGAEIVFGITLGTGVGGGIVINNKIYRGATGSAAEVGHMTIKFDGLKCGCGNLGCLEAYCSERFFKKMGTSPEETAKKAKAGNKFALRIFKDYGKNLGAGLSNIVNLLDPEIIVIGGGISKAHKFFLEEAKKEIKKRTLSPLSKKYVKIKIARLGEIAGAVGATFLVDY